MKGLSSGGGGPHVRSSRLAKLPGTETVLAGPTRELPWSYGVRLFSSSAPNGDVPVLTSSREQRRTLSLGVACLPGCPVFLAA